MEQIKIDDLRSQLAELRMQDIKEMDVGSLTELKDIEIDPKLPVTDRVMRLIEQAGNPYAYLDNGIKVKISFAQSGRTLQDCMEEYLLSELMPDLR